jgi:hypothetical protein
VIGPYYSGIAAYVLAAAAMVIGSLMKPRTSSDEMAKKTNTTPIVEITK